ncbi:hypothetical protein [Crocosphaera chwakensis]|uniref:PilZ domain-containing protein n=1 Tax=Crocosphaera chwakensis CCY0110 TaxID=391612 RepID=A3IRY0_9CHRO|nr:hypothetical protein [Crocosphaera chwakensis]EAZ90831.1 hypothetical protein CY0110_30406 [Crocosphaera chwakensis CCY0110]
MRHDNNFTQSILENNRKTHRFLLNKGTLVLLTFVTEENLLEESLEAMVIDYCLEGCGLIIVKDRSLISEQLLSLKPRDYCSIHIGTQTPIYGEIVWFKELDDRIIRLGVKYINY